MKQKTIKLTIESIKRVQGGMPLKTNIKAGTVTVKFQPETTSK